MPVIIKLEGSAGAAAAAEEITLHSSDDLISLIERTKHQEDISKLKDVLYSQKDNIIQMFLDGGLVVTQGSIPGKIFDFMGSKGDLEEDFKEASIARKGGTLGSRTTAKVHANEAKRLAKQAAAKQAAVGLGEVNSFLSTEGGKPDEEASVKPRVQAGVGGAARRRSAVKLPGGGTEDSSVGSDPAAKRAAQKLEAAKRAAQDDAAYRNSQGIDNYKSILSGGIFQDGVIVAKDPASEGALIIGKSVSYSAGEKEKDIYVNQEKALLQITEHARSLIASLGTVDRQAADSPERYTKLTAFITSLSEVIALRFAKAGVDMERKDGLEGILGVIELLPDTLGAQTDELKKAIDGLTEVCKDRLTELIKLGLVGLYIQLGDKETRVAEVMTVDGGKAALDKVRAVQEAQEAINAEAKLARDGKPLPGRVAPPYSEEPGRSSALSSEQKKTPPPLRGGQGGGGASSAGTPRPLPPVPPRPLPPVPPVPPASASASTGEKVSSVGGANSTGTPRTPLPAPPAAEQVTRPGTKPAIAGGRGGLSPAQQEPPLGDQLSVGSVSSSEGGTDSPVAAASQASQSSLAGSGAGVIKRPPPVPRTVAAGGGTAARASQYEETGGDGRGGIPAAASPAATFKGFALRPIGAAAGLSRGGHNKVESLTDFINVFKGRESSTQSTSAAQAVIDNKDALIQACQNCSQDELASLVVVLDDISAKATVAKKGELNDCVSDIKRIIRCVVGKEDERSSTSSLSRGSSMRQSLGRVASHLGRSFTRGKSEKGDSLTFVNLQQAEGGSRAASPLSNWSKVPASLFRTYSPIKGGGAGEDGEGLLDGYSDDDQRPGSESSSQGVSDDSVDLPSGLSIGHNLVGGGRGDSKMTTEEIKEKAVRLVKSALSFYENGQTDEAGLKLDDLCALPINEEIENFIIDVLSDIARADGVKDCDVLSITQIILPHLADHFPHDRLVYALADIFMRHSQDMAIATSIANLTQSHTDLIIVAATKSSDVNSALKAALDIVIHSENRQGGSAKPSALMKSIESAYRRLDGLHNLLQRDGSEDRSEQSDDESSIDVPSDGIVDIGGNLGDAPGDDADNIEFHTRDKLSDIANLYDLYQREAGGRGSSMIMSVDTGRGEIFDFAVNIGDDRVSIVFDVVKGEEGEDDLTIYATQAEVEKLSSHASNLIAVHRIWKKLEDSTIVPIKIGDRDVNTVLKDTDGTGIDDLELAEIDRELSARELTLGVEGLEYRVLGDAYVAEIASDSESIEGRARYAAALDLYDTPETEGAPIIAPLVIGARSLNEALGLGDEDVNLYIQKENLEISVGDILTTCVSDLDAEEGFQEKMNVYKSAVQNIKEVLIIVGQGQDSGLRSFAEGLSRDQIPGILDRAKELVNEEFRAIKGLNDSEIDANKEDSYKKAISRLEAFSEYLDEFKDDDDFDFIEVVTRAKEQADLVGKYRSEAVAKAEKVARDKEKVAQVRAARTGRPSNATASSSSPSAAVFSSGLSAELDRDPSSLGQSASGASGGGVGLGKRTPLARRSPASGARSGGGLSVRGPSSLGGGGGGLGQRSSNSLASPRATVPSSGPSSLGGGGAASSIRAGGGGLGQRSSNSLASPRATVPSRGLGNPSGRGPSSLGGGGVQAANALGRGRSSAAAEESAGQQIVDILKLPFQKNQIIQINDLYKDMSQEGKDLIQDFLSSTHAGRGRARLLVSTKVDQCTGISELRVSLRLEDQQEHSIGL